VNRRDTRGQKIEPCARLVAKRPPKITHGPVAARIASEESHVDVMIGHIRMWNAAIRVKDMI